MAPATPLTTPSQWKARRVALLRLLRETRRSYLCTLLYPRPQRPPLKTAATSVTVVPTGADKSPTSAATVTAAESPTLTKTDAPF